MRIGAGVAAQSSNMRYMDLSKELASTFYGASLAQDSVRQMVSMHCSSHGRCQRQVQASGSESHVGRDGGGPPADVRKLPPQAADLRSVALRRLLRRLHRV